MKTCELGDNCSQQQDAWKATNIMGIGCLSVNDCLIVPKVNTEDAKQAFYSDMLTSTENGLCSQSPKTYDVVIV